MNKTAGNKHMKPGDIDGRRGDWLRRYTLNGCVWHQHLENKKYRCKVVGQQLWTLKKGEKIDPASVQTIEREEITGLELVATMPHWWLDKEIKRPRLQREDWDFSSLKDGQNEWQLPWAWEYERWREWQPWSDFDRWRKDFKERGPAFSSLPWPAQFFAAYFPKKSWVSIPPENRVARLAKAKIGPNTPYGPLPSLEGTVAMLRKDVPEKQWALRDDEALEAHRRFLEAPGYYEDEKVKPMASGGFTGTYVIHVPWYYDDAVLDQAWVAWRKSRAAKLKGRRCISDHGKKKYFPWLRQLGALRLLREMTPEDALRQTGTFLHDAMGIPFPLFADGPRMKRAADMADEQLAQMWGVTDRTE